MTGTEPARPVLTSGRGGYRSTWLVLPGWGQSGAHWVPVARWLAHGGVRLLWLDMKALAESCEGERGSVRRLQAVAARVHATCRDSGTSMLVAHSAAAPVATLVAAGATGPDVALVEPVPAQFGVPVEPPPTAPADAPVGPRPLPALYPFAGAEALRQISAVTGSTDGESLAPAALLDAGPTGERVALVAHALRTVPAPIQVICGAASAVCPPPLAQRLCADAPSGSRLHVVDRAGHSPHIDRPQIVAEILTTCTTGGQPS